MPDISQIIALKEKYGSKNQVNPLQLRVLLEGATRSFSEIKNSFANRGLDNRILQYLENQTSTELIFLFIDITGFSKKCKDLTNSQLASYLDNYYDKVIPMIYAHGGEIEKIMGDGIIAIFGEPFLNDTKETLFKKADDCAKDIILLLKYTDKEVKIALHDGTIMYYKNKAVNHAEYTVIGKPLTELYRLESVALNNSISYYHVSSYDNKVYSQSGSYCFSPKGPKIRCGSFSKSAIQPVTLQGVDWSFVKHLTCTYATE
ncbi:adenylate/guanylate cyclase domain-containing protein [Mucilaginibacter sp. UC70_90]